MNLVSLSLLLSAGLLVSPARAERTGEDHAARIRALTNRAALRALQPMSMSMSMSMPLSDETETAEFIVSSSGPPNADIAAALNVMAADIEDPDKTIEDTVSDTLESLIGVEVDGSFFDLPLYQSCKGSCDAVGPFSCACFCLLLASGVNVLDDFSGARERVCGILGPIADALEQAIGTGIGPTLLNAFAEVLGFVDNFIPDNSGEPV